MKENFTEHAFPTPSLQTTVQPCVSPWLYPFPFSPKRPQLVCIILLLFFKFYHMLYLYKHYV